MARPERITISVKAGKDFDAARAAFSELYGSLHEAGADVSMLLQESSEPPPLVLYIAMSLLGRGIVNSIAQVVIAWMNRNRAIVKAINIDGTEVSIDASENLVRDLLHTNSKRR
jgi:hypothetical protein